MNNALFIIHLLNLAGLLGLNLILILGAVITPWHFVLPLPTLLLSILYWPLRKNTKIVAFCLGLSIATVLWVIFCENIVTVDNILRTKITTGLDLGFRLQSYVDRHLRGERPYFQQCCNDPLSFNRKPGSKAYGTYDCSGCNERDETIVDETGYLNRELGLFQSNTPIDLFVAGDSVLQGAGMPSVVELLRDKIPVKIWNLSISACGPRQKVNALIAYALPKHPKWVIVEFFSGNDVSDAIDFEICEGANDFRCGLNGRELYRRLLAHPVYSAMIDSSDRTDIFGHVAANNFTLSVTRYFIHTTKDIIRGALISETHRSLSRDNHANSYSLMYPASAWVKIRRGKVLQWAKKGMAVTYKEYERMYTRIAYMESKPEVILLYNPSGYEIYRGILGDRDLEHDEVSEFQFYALQSFAADHGWIFLDLTQPLRDELKNSKVWIYGQYDNVHWSHKGTAIVAPVLAMELLKVIENER